MELSRSRRRAWDLCLRSDYRHSALDDEDGLLTEHASWAPVRIFLSPADPDALSLFRHDVPRAVIDAKRMETRIEAGRPDNGKALAIKSHQPHASFPSRTLDDALRCGKAARIAGSPGRGRERDDGRL